MQKQNYLIPLDAPPLTSLAINDIKNFDSVCCFCTSGFLFTFW